MNSAIEKEAPEVESPQGNSASLYFDSLNRGDFVKKVIEIIENLASQRESMCYAIKGSWGVGKTHVLDIIEKELLNEWRKADAYDKYILFHYNAWEYDYYAEPLFAMVTSMHKSLDKMFSLVPEETLTKIKKVFEPIIDIVEATGKLFGIDKFSSVLQKGNGMSKDIEAQILDSNHFLNKTMKKIKDSLKEQSKNVTIIVVVDELDRCLPEYAIKVLERLHHIFGDVENTQVILSVDYDQLENTVKTIFGESTSTKRYLSKFINFSITLDEGHLDNNFDKQFPKYVQLFKTSSRSYYDYNIEDGIEQFKNIIFEGIDMRQRKELVNKSLLIHTLVNDSKEKLDTLYMCAELLLTLWKSIIGDQDPHFSYPYCFSDGVNKNSPNSLPPSIPQGLKSIEEVYLNSQRKKADRREYDYYYEENARNRYVHLCDIWGVILFCMTKISDSNCNVEQGPIFINHDYMEYIKKYWGMLQLIN